MNRQIKRLLFVCGLFFSAVVYAFTPLPADEAFQLSSHLKNQQIIATFKVAPHYYLYRHTIHIQATDGQTILSNVVLPKGTPKYDKYFGHYQALSGTLQLNIPIVQAGKTLSLNFAYQGCAAGGFCYPPIQKVFTYTNPTPNIKTATTSAMWQQSLKNFSGGNFSFATLFENTSAAFVLLIFFVIGLLLAFTPCVLPTIPLLAALLAGQSSISTRRAFGLCFTFVLSMSLAYGLAGWFAGKLGFYFQASLQQPWVIGLSIVFILLFAAYLFGFLQFSFFSRWQNTLDRWRQRLPGGSYLSAVLMGFLLTLVVSPCITPPLVGAISYLAHEGNPLLGAASLFLLGFGMGLPLLIAGTLGAHYLTKFKHVSVWVKNLFGFTLIALAIYLATRLFTPARADLPPGFSEATHPQQLAQLLHHAKEMHKPVLLDYYATYCISCLHIEHEVFGNAQVQQALMPYQPIRVNVSTNDHAARELLNAYQVIAPPTIIFLDKNGQQIAEKRIVGSISAAGFLLYLK